MKFDKLQSDDDSKTLADPVIAEFFGQKRRNIPLEFTEVKNLIQALHPGMARQANLERYADKWRLRFSLYDEGGGARRRSIIIKDAATMEWVRDFLDQARKKRKDYKHELWLQRFNKRREDVRKDMYSSYLSTDISSVVHS